MMLLLRPSDDDQRPGEGLLSGTGAAMGVGGTQPNFSENMGPNLDRDSEVGVGWGENVRFAVGCIFSHNTLRDGQTDGQKDDSMMPIADHTGGAIFWGTYLPTF